MVQDSSNNNTVRFDVGGHLYKVSRSLLELYPETTLATMVNAHWQNGNNTDEPIFIDRDGDNFRYVLAYMRDHRVTLPITVPVANLRADLAYYAFPEPKESDIVSERLDKAIPFVVSLTICSSANDDHMEKLDRLITESSDQTKRLEQQKNALLTAKLIANRAMKIGWNGKGFLTVLLENRDEKKNASEGAKAIHHHDGSKLFEKYLSYFGLAYVSDEHIEEWLFSQNTQIVVKRTNDDMWSQRTLILPSSSDGEGKVVARRRSLDKWFRATTDRITKLNLFFNKAVDVYCKWAEVGVAVVFYFLCGLVGWGGLVGMVYLMFSLYAL